MRYAAHLSSRALGQRRRNVVHVALPSRVARYRLREVRHGRHVLTRVMKVNHHRVVQATCLAGAFAFCHLAVAVGNTTALDYSLTVLVGSDWPQNSRDAEALPVDSIAA